MNINWIKVQIYIFNLKHCQISSHNNIHTEYRSKDLCKILAEQPLFHAARGL